MESYLFRLNVMIINQNFIVFVMYNIIRDVKDWISVLYCVKKQTLQVLWKGGSTELQFNLNLT